MSVVQKIKKEKSILAQIKVQLFFWCSEMHALEHFNDTLLLKCITIHWQVLLHSYLKYIRPLSVYCLADELRQGCF